MSIFRDWNTVGWLGYREGKGGGSYIVRKEIKMVGRYYVSFIKVFGFELMY